MTVIGCGHLGATHAATMAEIGHDVVGVDTDPGKVEILNSGRAWFREPGLDDLLARHVGGRLRFTTDITEAARHGEVHFLGVGTPGGEGGAYDLSQVFAAAEALAPHLTNQCLIVGKSTVSVGTTAAVAARVQALAPAGELVEVAWSPEFLREGHAVADTLRPDRIVAGVTSEWAEKLIRECFAPIADAGVPLIVADPATIELVKGSANAFLATKVSFMNAIADLAEQVGADAAVIADAIGCDARIGRAMLTPGLGYGGGCLPKDVRAFAARAAEVGVGDSFAFLREIDAVNQNRRTRVADRVRMLCDYQLDGAPVAVWGAAFKPGTDDVRDSPALDVAARLHQSGAKVTVYDPMAMTTARTEHPELSYASSAIEAARGAHVIVVGTDWPQFTDADPAEVGQVVTHRQIIDARSVLDVDRWTSAGWRVHRLGQG